MSLGQHLSGQQILLVKIGPILKNSFALWGIKGGVAIRIHQGGPHLNKGLQHIGGIFWHKTDKKGVFARFFFDLPGRLGQFRKGARGLGDVCLGQQLGVKQGDPRREIPGKAKTVAVKGCCLPNFGQVDRPLFGAEPLV